MNWDVNHFATFCLTWSTAATIFRCFPSSCKVSQIQDVQSASNFIYCRKILFTWDIFITIGSCGCDITYLALRKQPNCLALTHTNSFHTMQVNLGGDGTHIDAKNWPEHFLFYLTCLYICICFHCLYFTLLCCETHSSFLFFLL